MFKRYGDEYFLSEIWSAPMQSGYVVTTSARENELIEQGMQAEEVRVICKNGVEK